MTSSDAIKNLAQAEWTVDRGYKGYRIKDRSTKRTVADGMTFRDALDVLHVVDASRDLIEANKLMKAGLTPEIVCLCGSTRFMDAFQQANKDLSLAGKIVLTVALVTSDATNSEVTAEQKAKLEVLHREKIALADSIYVLNVGGYIGESTRSEIEYAKSLGKPVVYLEKKESNQ